MGLIRQRGGGYRLPAIGMVGRQLRAALPGQVRRGLAPGVGKLERNRHVRPTAQALHNAAHCRFVRVIPEAGIPIADPPLRQDGRCLDGQQGGSGKGEMPQMNEMPVGHTAIDGRILAHRGNDDAIAHLQAANLQRIEQFRAGH